MTSFQVFRFSSAVLLVGSPYGTAWGGIAVGGLSGLLSQAFVRAGALSTMKLEAAATPSAIHKLDDYLPAGSVFLTSLRYSITVRLSRMETAGELP